MSKELCRCLEDGIALRALILNDDRFLSGFDALATKMVDTIACGGKIITCGNGGSASDALHFAAEIVGRFQQEREAWPALALNSDVAAMTAIANDYGYSEVFARQVSAHATDKDLLIGISTSGNSNNVRRAVEVAKFVGCETAALLGRDGGMLAHVVDYPLIVASDVTARIQELHITCIHALCEVLERQLIK